MGLAIQGLRDWPVAVWVVLIGVALFAGQYAVLYGRWRRGRPQEQAAEHRLVEVASRLRAYAAEHGQRLPERLADVWADPDSAVTYRPAPSLTLDERLVLLHDTQPARNLLQFPSLRRGRGVVLCSGRVLLLAEEAFEKLIDADNRLRQSLGLAELEQRLAE